MQISLLKKTAPIQADILYAMNVFPSERIRGPSQREPRNKISAPWPHKCRPELIQKQCLLTRAPSLQDLTTQQDFCEDRFLKTGPSRTCLTRNFSARSYF